MNINLNNATYDFLNALVRVILPAAGALYFGLSQIWGFPWAEEIVGSIAVVVTFLGLVIMLARNGWAVDDVLQVSNDPEEVAFGFKEDPRLIEHLEDGQTVTLKVEKVDTLDDRENF